jgi:CheY-like chemotaxis protein
MQKIMLVDDDIDIIDTYRPVLEAAGYEVRVAHDGKSGFELFREFLPDAAVIDLAMEHFDSGFTLCKRIKDTPEGRGIPVIIMTSAGHDTGIRFSTQSEEEKQWIKADHYLDKPVPPQDLVQFLHDRVLKAMHEKD